MNEEMPPVEQVVEFQIGNKVIYKDGRKCKITRPNDDLYLGKGLVEVKFENGKIEGVRAEDLEKEELKEPEEAEIPE